MGKAIFPKLIELAKRQGKKIVAIDIDQQLLIKGQLLVFAAPTVLVMHEGREVVRESKFIDLNKIERYIESL